MNSSNLIAVLSCKLPTNKRAIEAIYSLIWKREKKDRDLFGMTHSESTNN